MDPEPQSTIIFNESRQKHSAHVRELHVHAAQQMQLLRQRLAKQDQARAFQRLCRSHGQAVGVTAAVSVRQAQYQLPRTFSTSLPQQARRSKQANPDDGNGDEINFYEQEFVRGEQGAVRRVGGPRSLQKRIQELERELEALKSGESLDWLPENDREELRRGIREARQTGELDEDASLGRDELEQLLGDQPAPEQQVRDLLAEEEDKERKELENETGEEEDSPPEVALRLPDVQTKTLRKFNRALRSAAASEPAPNAARLLWQSYRASKQNVPGVLQGLPASAWEILWTSQYEPGALAEDVRSKHLWILLDDMIATDVPLTPTQKVVRVEGHMVAGRLGKAMRWWNQCRQELAEDPDVGTAFLELGPRIRAEMGDLEAAEKLALEIGTAESGKASFFVPVIESLLQTGSDNAISQAAGLYVKMRCALGSRIGIQDFDRLAMAFLRQGQSDVAVGVFRDLIAFCRKGASDKDDESAEAYQTSMRLYAKITADSPDAIALSTTARQALCFLPRRLENRFFYASWLKRLIGLGELDAAARVLELMHQRKVRPDAIHLNGVISAWLRGARPADVELALGVAHNMIQKRIAAVNARETARTGRELHLPASALSANDESGSPSLPRYLAENIPSATIETFSILLLHYSRHDMRASITALQSALHAARLEPNAFFLNHLLRTHQRAQEFTEAWSLFSTSQRNNVRPDLETFACLWDMCRAHAARHTPGAMQSFPQPRGLFSHMTAWMASASQREQAAARRQFSPALYAVILRSFFVARDLRGCLVALHALREVFGVYPDEQAALCVTGLVAAIGDRGHEKVFVPGVGRVRIRGAKGAYLRRKKGLVSDKESVAQERVAGLLGNVREARRAELEGLGVSGTELADQARSEEALWVLSSFLREALRERAVYVAARNEGDAEREDIVGGEDEKIEKVAFEMGAGGLTLGAPEYEKKNGRWEVVGYEEE